jgi:hypothetical protein
MVAQLDGKLVIGGDFTTVDGVVRNRIARLNTDGSLDLFFDVGTGADGTVYSVALTPDEHVIIGGDFYFVNGLPRRGVARLNPDDPIDVQILPGAGFVNGNFQLQINCKPGHPYALEASGNLISWITLRTNFSAGSTLSFTDTNVTSNNRFYRVRQVVP